MLLTLTGHPFRYECENLCRLFFPYSPVRVEEQPELPTQPTASPEGEPWAQALAEAEPGGVRYQVRAGDGEKALEDSRLVPVQEEYALTDLLYQVFSRLTGLRPAWGMLTGVHPVKLLRQTVQRAGEGPDFAASLEAGLAEFQEKWHVTPPKAELAGRVLRAQREAVEALRPEDFSLYVGIPFCPTRCAYCSFISQDLAHAKKLVEPYFQLLLAELEKTARVAGDLGLRLVSVYMGGGTPTTLSAAQLGRLCGAIAQLFDMSSCREFTVEAGRPDTITREKLEALKGAGVGRISINPQSLSDQVLQTIGRAHSAAGVEAAFALARQVGFRDINADLIVGLPGDGLEGFQRSLEGVLAFGAANVTVHALALKRSSRLVTEDEDISSHKKSAEAAAMVEHSIQRLTGAGFVPYYLYRQTRMAGNLENTGWALPGSICRYNIYTMDESCTVIACGAGGVSKIKDPASGDLTRIFNFKYPAEYIERHGEILQRKDGVIGLYEQFRQRLH